MIDDCGGVDESSEKSVGFVQEWINTYAFLSREFPSFYFFSLLVFPSFRVPISRAAVLHFIFLLPGYLVREKFSRLCLGPWDIVYIANEVTSVFLEIVLERRTCWRTSSAFQTRAWVVEHKNFFMQFRRQLVRALNCEVSAKNISRNTIAWGARKSDYSHPVLPSTLQPKVQNSKVPNTLTLASPAEILIKCRLRQKISPRCERLPGFEVKGETRTKGTQWHISTWSL